jgi:putative membrane protein
MKQFLHSATLLAFLALGGAAAAQGVADDDAGFLKQAAHNGHAELVGSKLAQQRASSANVKAFAQRMVEDHAKTNAELEQLAASKGVQLPQQPDAAQQAKLKALGGLSGAEFDQQYVEQMGVAAHEQTIALFQRGASNARDPQIKSFAAQTLPALQQHLEMARALKTGKAK